MLSGNQFTATASIYSDNFKGNKELPSRDFEFILVSAGVQLKEEYEYILAPLKELLNASIQTGNPVIWT